MGIPRKIHYVWLGGNPMPARHKAYIREWGERNPGYQIKRWDENNIDWECEYTRAAYSAKAWAKLSDLVRLRAIYNEGGIYLDTDVQVVRSLAGLLDNRCFFGYQSLREQDDPVCNAVFGGVAGDPFLGNLLNAFPFNLRNNFNTSGTGPEIVSKILLSRGLTKSSDRLTVIGGVTIYPRTFFYPYHWSEDFSPACISAQTLCVHHWDMSWHQEKSRFRRVVKDQLKRFPPLHRGVRRIYRSLKLRY